MIFDRILKFFRLSTTSRKEPSFLLESLLGFVPSNMDYYELALLHKSSAVRDRQGHIRNNERLEYLGDAVLEAVASDFLYTKFPDKEEGYLTSLRSKIVQRETLNRVSVDMGIDKLLVLPVASHTHNINVYGNAFEALIGAIYLDQGYEKVMWFMNNIFFQKYVDVNSLSALEQNFKSRLIEWGHKYKVTVDFITIDEKKDRHNNILFKSNVMVNGYAISEGIGYSKRSSHQMAAQKALDRLTNEKDLLETLLTADVKETLLQEK